MNDSHTSVPGDFQDPLDNFDSREFKDDLDRTLAEEVAAGIYIQPFRTIPADMPVKEALQTLTGIDIASVLVVDQKKLVGIFTDRDVLDRVALELDKVKEQPVSRVMTKQPVFVHETDSAAAVLCVMAAAGYRHVPVVDENDEVVGVVSPQRIYEFLSEHFSAT